MVRCIVLRVHRRVFYVLHDTVPSAHVLRLEKYDFAKFSQPSQQIQVKLKDYLEILDVNDIKVGSGFNEIMNHQPIVLLFNLKLV